MSYGVSPNTCTSPASGRSSPTAMCNRVVLPAPFGPTRAATRPSGRRSEQSRNAQVLPYRLPSWAVSSTVSIVRTRRPLMRIPPAECRRRAWLERSCRPARQCPLRSARPPVPGAATSPSPSAARPALQATGRPGCAVTNVPTPGRPSAKPSISNSRYALVAAVRGSTDETKVQVRRISEPLQTAPELMAVLRRVGVLPGKVITVTTTPTKRRGKDEAS